MKITLFGIPMRTQYLSRMTSNSKNFLKKSNVYILSIDFRSDTVSFFKNIFFHQIQQCLFTLSLTMN